METEKGFWRVPCSDVFESRVRLLVLLEKRIMLETVFFGPGDEDGEVAKSQIRITTRLVALGLPFRRETG